LMAIMEVSVIFGDIYSLTGQIGIAQQRSISLLTNACSSSSLREIIMMLTIQPLEFITLILLHQLLMLFYIQTTDKSKSNTCRFMIQMQHMRLG
jgi:hypothetical protein